MSGSAEDSGRCFALNQGHRMSVTLENCLGEEIET